MGDWPKRLAGHYIDRELASMTGDVGYRYRCIKCGLRVPNPDGSTLRLRPCDSLVHGTGRGP